MLQELRERGDGWEPRERWKVLERQCPELAPGGGLGVMWKGEVTLPEQTLDPTAWGRVC